MGITSQGGLDWCLGSGAKAVTAILVSRPEAGRTSWDSLAKSRSKWQNSWPQIGLHFS